MFQDGEFNIVGLYGINKNSGPTPMPSTHHRHHHHLPLRHHHHRRRRPLLLLLQEVLRPQLCPLCGMQGHPLEAIKSVTEDLNMIIRFKKKQVELCLFTLSYFSFNLAPFLSYGCLFSAEEVFHISPNFFAVSPIVSPGCSLFIFARKSPQNRKNADLRGEMYQIS